MPGYDGTGPFGTGPSGRGLGPCGGGQAVRGRGLGNRRGGRPGYYSPTSSSDQTKEFLEIEKIRLENLLKNIEARISGLSNIKPE